MILAAWEMFVEWVNGWPNDAFSIWALMTISRSLDAEGYSDHSRLWLYRDHSGLPFLFLCFLASGVSISLQTAPQHYRFCAESCQQEKQDNPYRSRQEGLLLILKCREVGKAGFSRSLLVSTCHSEKQESRGSDHPTENEPREQISFEKAKIFRYE